MPERLVHIWEKKRSLFERKQRRYTRDDLRIFELQKAARGADTLVCADDRLSHIRGVHLVGAGLLLYQTPEIIRHIIQASGVTKIMSHHGCKGAALAAAEMGFLPGMTDSEVDRFSRFWTGLLADRHHLIHEPQYCPPQQQIHIGLKICYDTTGHIKHIPRAEGLLPGYLISRKYLSSQNGVRQLRAIYEVAFDKYSIGSVSGQILLKILAYSSKTDPDPDSYLEEINSDPVLEQAIKDERLFPKILIKPRS